jgi:hypothetical protein
MPEMPEMPEEREERRNYPNTPAPGMAGLAQRARASAGFALALSSSLGTAALVVYQLVVQPYVHDRALAWIFALVAIISYVASKLPHVVGQEPGDYVSLCREVLYSMLNAGIAVVAVATHRPQPAISSALALFFVAAACVEIIIAMRLTSRSWNQSSMGRL